MFNIRFALSLVLLKSRCWRIAPSSEIWFEFRLYRWLSIIFPRFPLFPVFHIGRLHQHHFSSTSFCLFHVSCGCFCSRCVCVHISSLKAIYCHHHIGHEQSIFIHQGREMCIEKDTTFTHKVQSKERMNEKSAHISSDIRLLFKLFEFKKKNIKRTGQLRTFTLRDIISSLWTVYECLPQTIIY